MASRLHRVVFGSVFMSGSAAALITAYLSSDESAKKPEQKNGARPKRLPPLPSRCEQLQALQKEEFDVLVVGGGATGSGVALDAVSRGLKTAMVELDDFSSGTSSRSTKLIHGGVRYLQKAIMALDLEQYRMVKEALYERANLLAIAPHLSYPLPIMLPVYKWWQVPYYWVGIKMYDLVAGSKCLKQSYFLSKSKALELFPMLKKDKLCGAIVYYDGQHNDARMNLAIALTATRMGATIANHVAVVALHKRPGKDGCMEISGARCKDLVTGKEFDVSAKCVINATGPFTDSIRSMDSPSAPPICQPSSGVHIILPDYYSPQMMGLLDPSTSDGRVIFFLPWQGVTIAGTTDNPCEVTHSPAPSEADIQFILKEIRGYLSPDIEVRRGDVLSAWAGIRPLVLDPNKESTESIARNHIIHVSSSKLVTIAGGKWTTYRAMAKEAVDAAVEATCLKPESGSNTDGLLLEGAHAYSPIMYIRLVQDFGLDSEVALHLANTYGDRAFSVAKLARLTGIRWPIVGRRLHQEFPYIEAEVRYAVKEYACSAVDVIARRLRLAFLNCQAAEEALPRIVEIMAEELNWSKAEQKVQKENALKFLRCEMGMDINKASREEAPINLTREEIKDYIKRFQTLDVDKKGYISINDLRRSFKKHGEMVTEQELHEILREVDISRNGQVELGEYLQMMSARKSGAISHSRFAITADREFEDTKKKYSVERSGGGL
uniref:Glycerol-3-phosphate dehydrogenase n=1 Tax=Hemiscolopendra marginata TaxID=943146 RepID=A0A646QGJ3_9MYRI